MARVLIADDEPAIRDVIASTCRLDGHEVHTVATMADALAAYRTERPDLMILDIHMPGGGAEEILVHLDQTTDGPICPVIVVSGFSAAAVEHARVIEVIQKPFGIDALRIAIKTALASAA